jgi:hypothetical protein
LTWAAICSPDRLQRERSAPALKSAVIAKNSAVPSMRRFSRKRLNLQAYWSKTPVSSCPFMQNPLFLPLFPAELYRRAARLRSSEAKAPPPLRPQLSRLPDLLSLGLRLASIVQREELD